MCTLELCHIREMKGSVKERVFFFLARVYLNIFSKSAWRGDPMPFLPAHCYGELVVLGEKPQSFVL